MRDLSIERLRAGMLAQSLAKFGVSRRRRANSIARQHAPFDWCISEAYSLDANPRDILPARS